MNPKISYVICATQRSGTHFLGEALQSTGTAGDPDEYLICDQNGRLQNEQGNIAQIYGKKTLEEFHQLVLELGSTPNGVFGITIMWNYFYKIRRNYQHLSQYQGLDAAEFMDTLLLSPKYIWLIRRDKMRQAVSWAKASQTGIWSRPKDITLVPKREPVFDFLLIDHFYREILTGEAGWANFFQSNDIEPLKIIYEDAVEAYEQTVFDILDYLEISYSDELTFRERRLQKQANRLNEEWADRYRRMKQRPLRTTTIRALHFMRQNAKDMLNYLRRCL